MLVNAFTFTSNYDAQVFALDKGVPSAGDPMPFGQIRNAGFAPRNGRQRPGR